MSDCYPPRTGGIETQVSGLARRLQEAGDRVEVITATPGTDRGTPGGQRVHRLLPPVPVPVPVGPWGSEDLVRLLEGADVVHVHQGVVAPLAARAVGAAVRLGLPTVMTWHSMPGHVAPPDPLLRRWRGWVRDGVLPTSVGAVAAGRVAGLLGTGPGSVAVLPNGIDPAPWRPPPAATTARPGDGTLTLVSALRLTRRKRPHVLLPLLRRLQRALPHRRLRLVLVGAGPLLHPLRAAVARGPLAGTVHLPGRLGPAALAGLYHRADAYVAPTRLESFGIAALEARVAGLPVAGLAGSGLGEFVTDGVHGVLARDDADLAARLAGLLADPAALAVMAERNRTTDPDQVWQRVVPQVRRLYRSAPPTRSDAPTPSPPSGPTTSTPGGQRPGGPGSR